jgi:hypothetical protein
MTVLAKASSNLPEFEARHPGLLSVLKYLRLGQLCRQQEVVHNHEDSVRNIRQGEARHRKYKKLKPGGGQT